MDGFRCDAAPMVPSDFWEQARTELSAVKPDIMMLDEGEKPELLVKAFDVDYSWKLMWTLNDVINHDAPASNLRRSWEEGHAQYPKDALRMRISDDHDETRAIARYGVNGALAASALMFTLDGVPVSPTNVTKLSSAAAGAVPYTAEERESAAAQVASGQPENQVIPGYGKDAVEARRQTRKDAIKQIMDASPGMSASAAGIELANRTIEFQAGKRSEGQLITMLGATKQALSQLDFNIDKAKEEMTKLPSSNISPVINAIERGDEKWSGDPAYSGLFYYMHATAVESARLLSGGQASTAQLHQGAMDEAQKWASINMTPASFGEVGDAMKEEGANKIQTYKDAIEYQKIHAPGDQPAADHPPVPAGVPLDKSPVWSKSAGKFFWKDDAGNWQSKAP